MLENPELLASMDDPPYELCLAVVRKDGMAIRHIRRRTLELELVAVAQNSMALTLIENPHTDHWVATCNSP